MVGLPLFFALPLPLEVGLLLPLGVLVAAAEVTTGEDDPLLVKVVVGDAKTLGEEMGVETVDKLDEILVDSVEVSEGDPAVLPDALPVCMPLFAPPLLPLLVIMPLPVFFTLTLPPAAPTKVLLPLLLPLMVSNEVTTPWEDPEGLPVVLKVAAIVGKAAALALPLLLVLGLVLRLLVRLELPEIERAVDGEARGVREVPSECEGESVGTTAEPSAVLVEDTLEIVVPDPPPLTRIGVGVIVLPPPSPAPGVDVGVAATLDGVPPPAPGLEVRELPLLIVLIPLRVWEGESVGPFIDILPPKEEVG